MDGISERVRLMGDLQAAVTEALTGTLRERGRGFASDREAWAELKECVERTKKMHSDIEKVHKEMWSAVTDHNGDAFAALSQEFERSATRAHFGEPPELGFSVIATIDPGKPPEHYGETRICHGNEVIYPDRMKKEDLPPWAVDVLTTFGFTSDYGNATVRR